MEIEIPWISISAIFFFLQKHVLHLLFHISSNNLSWSYIGSSVLYNFSKIYFAGRGGDCIWIFYSIDFFFLCSLNGSFFLLRIWYTPPFSHIWFLKRVGEEASHSETGALGPNLTMATRPPIWFHYIFRGTGWILKDVFTLELMVILIFDDLCLLILYIELCVVLFGVVTFFILESND